MFAAADAYRAHFGEASAVYQFMGWPRELARGEPVTTDDLYRRLGVMPPPDDAVL